MSEQAFAGEAPTLEQQFMNAVREGDLRTVTSMVDREPGLVALPIGQYGWTALHAAAHTGHLEMVEFLLSRGAEVNARESGDNTYAMHWAAAAGHVDVVRRLADAGGDVIGAGDDHQLEVIGWASCWNECDDAAHHAIVDLLLERGAHHHVFSAIAMDDGDEVRRIVARDQTVLEARMSRNEGHQRPLQFATRRDRPTMVALLIELGADPSGTDSSGYRAAMFATTPAADHDVMAALYARGRADLPALLALGKWDEAEALLASDDDRWSRNGVGFDALPLMAKRGDLPAVEWLIVHGAPVDALWPHWDANVTPLHLAILANHADVVRRLLDAGADPSIHDSKHDGDALDWARFFERDDIVRLLGQRGRS